VAGQQGPAGGELPPLPEDADVGMAEAVDGLELVADEEQLGRSRSGAEEIDELALEPVRVLELVDHDRAEAQPLAVADLGVVAKKVARRKLEVLEVERRLVLLRLSVGLGEAVEKLLQKVPVPGRQPVQRRLLDSLPRLLVDGPAIAADPKLGEVEEPVGPRVALEHDEERACALALPIRGRRVFGQAASSRFQLGDALAERQG